MFMKSTNNKGAAMNTTDQQVIAETNLKTQIRAVQNSLHSLLEAWHDYEDAFGNVEAPVEGYPFSESLDEVAYAAQAMRLTPQIGA